MNHGRRDLGRPRKGNLKKETGIDGITEEE